MRQKPVASLESALGNQRALVNALDYILRALLLCSGYGFSREPRASAQHHTHDILPRGAATHTECVTGWSILQKIWERDFGTPGVSHAAECVFAADED